MQTAVTAGNFHEVNPRDKVRALHLQYFVAVALLLSLLLFLLLFLSLLCACACVRVCQCLSVVVGEAAVMWVVQ